MICDFCKQKFSQKDGILLSITDYQFGFPITTQSSMCPQCENTLHRVFRALMISNDPDLYLDRSESYYKLKYDTPNSEGETE